jgi:HlyD family secretion protein
VATAQAGTITELPVRNSDVVEAGALLASIDATELRLNLQKARESLVLAIARFTEKRAFVNASAVTQQGLDDPAPAQQELLAGTLSAEDFRVLADAPRFDALFRTITRQEVAAAQDRLMTERANFAQAELDLAHAGTYAPFAGQVSDLQVIVGQRVGAGASLLTLIDADPVRVRVDVLESEAGRVRGGRRAEVRFAAYPGAVFAGEVEAISPVVDPETRTMAVTVSLPNPGLRLKPGMFASIALETEIFADRLLVPADAVLLRDERPMLFVVRDGRARWAYIEKGQENADWVEVLSGVDAGDEVVISGHYSLAHDAAVRVVDSEAHGDLDDSADAGAGDGAR